MGHSGTDFDFGLTLPHLALPPSFPPSSPIAVKIVSFVELLFERILFSFSFFLYQIFYKYFCLELHKQIKRNVQVKEVEKKFIFHFLFTLSLLHL